MKKMIYEKGSLKRNEDGIIIGATKGHYVIKEVNNKSITFKSIIKYLIGFSCSTTLVFCLLELCGYVGNF